MVSLFGQHGSAGVPALRRHIPLTPFAFWLVPTAFLAALPLFLWTGVGGAVMNLGGDDSHLLFAYPNEWLFNFSLSPIHQNLTGYNPQTHFIPLSLILIVVKATGLNPQGVAFGATLALTYLGVGFLTIKLIGKVTWSARLSGAVAGSIVVCAPILSATQWTHLLAAIFWLPLLPWIVILFILHQQSGRLRFIVAGGLASLVAAPAINSVAWTLPSGLAVLGIALVAGLCGVFSFHWRRSALFLLGILVINAFWVIPLFFNLRVQPGATEPLLSPQSKAEAVRIVTVLAPLMDIEDALALRISQPLMSSFQWAQIEPNEWSLSLAPLGYLPLLVIGGSTLKLFLSRETPPRSMVGLLTLSGFFLYLSTVNVFPGGIELFSWLMRNVPGWTLMRNFFDKAAIPFAVSTALATAVCFYHLMGKLPFRIILGGTAILVLGFGTYNWPFLSGDYFRLPSFGDSSFNRVMEGLPDDYLWIALHLRRMPPGNVASLPLSSPAWSVIPSEDGRGVYIGISPIYILTGRSDYNGIDSFNSPAAPHLREFVRVQVERRDTEALGRLLGAIGVRYLLLDMATAGHPEYLRVRADPAPQVQVSAALSRVPTKFLVQRGRFQLREMESPFGQDLVAVERLNTTAEQDLQLYLQDLGLLETMPADDPCTGTLINVLRHSRTRYTISIRGSEARCQLVLREAFDPGWHARIIKTQDSSSPEDVKSFKARGFANGFRIPPAGRGNVQRIELVYRPQGLLLLGFSVTTFSLLGLAGIGVRRRLNYWQGVRRLTG